MLSSHVLVSQVSNKTCNTALKQFTCAHIALEWKCQPVVKMVILIWERYPCAHIDRAHSTLWKGWYGGLLSNMLMKRINVRWSDQTELWLGKNKTVIYAKFARSLQYMKFTLMLTTASYRYLTSQLQNGFSICYMGAKPRCVFSKVSSTGLHKAFNIQILLIAQDGKSATTPYKAEDISVKKQAIYTSLWFTERSLCFTMQPWHLLTLAHSQVQ